MPSKTFSLVALLVLGVVFLVITSGSNALADGFTDKRVRFDGKLTKGQLDENKNMGFWPGKMGCHGCCQVQSNCAGTI